MAHPKGLNWVASGGLDRILNLWDINEQRGHPTRGSFELIVLKNTESSSGAIYSLGCDKNGSILVTGSLDKLVRIWDPKLPSDSSQIMRLQSHSDLVRDLIVSDDGRWVISCSSDATIKLWSLAMPNHCVATFSNNSDASVWCLASESPTLETFWAGTRDGWVYKIKKTVVADEYFSDCVGLCKQDTPILKVIIAKKDSNHGG